MEKLKRSRAILSPDFSMYLEMAPVIQLYNVFRNRWCGAYFSSKGIRVVPTVSWGDENTFDFSFDGIPRGSTVAVSTYMVSAHGNYADQKEFFMKGYREMLQRIEPERIICYNELWKNVHDKQAEVAPPKKFVMRSYRAGTYIGEIRLSAIFGRG